MASAEFHGGPADGQSRQFAGEPPVTVNWMVMGEDGPEPFVYVRTAEEPWQYHPEGD